MKRGIVIPTYNERNNIEPLITEIFRTDPDLHIIVVDDNSPDGTADVIKKLCRAYPDKIRLISEDAKQGLGPAYIAGISAAIEDGWDLICEMDADLSHQPPYLADLFEWSFSHGMVMGSRYIRGGGIDNWNIARRLLSRFGNIYARCVLGVKIKDLTSGFRCYRREVIEKINLKDIKSNGYSFQIETAYRTLLAGFKIKEIPIVFIERKQGRSKMSNSIIMEAILMVWKLRFQRKSLIQDFKEQPSNPAEPEPEPEPEQEAENNMNPEESLAQVKKH
jgi:dolichol-phosphate mannosyltransferase